MKHGRGPLSELRFARLRAEKKHVYVRSQSIIMFLVDIPRLHSFNTNGNNRCDSEESNVPSLVLAGPADFKAGLGPLDLFDMWLQEKVIKIMGCS